MATLTLAQLEQAAAPLLGPYFPLTASGGTTTTISVPELQSTLELGGYAHLYVLRRSAADPDDRIRRVKLHTPSSGTLDVDRSYTNAPSASEAIELHNLHPEHELRRSVQQALWHCYRAEEVSLTLSGAAVERDVTTSIPWITNPRQIVRAAVSQAGALTAPVSVAWLSSYIKEGKVLVRMHPDPYPNTLILTAIRPVATWVNTGSGFATSATGPTADAHQVIVDEWYAVAATRIEAWKYARAAMEAAAAEKLTLPEAAASVAYGRIRRREFKRSMADIGFDAYFSLP